MMSPGVITTGTLEAAGDDLNGVLTGEVYMPIIDSAANREFVATFKQAYEGRQPGKLEAVSFEAVNIIAQAMEEASSTSDYEAMVKVIEETEFTTPRGAFMFAAQHKSSAETYFIQVVEDGELVLREEVSKLFDFSDTRMSTANNVSSATSRGQVRHKSRTWSV